MREGSLNGENGLMRRVYVTATLASALALAACGGGGSGTSGSKPAPTAKPTPSGNGGVVTAEPTKGFLGPAVTGGPQGEKTFGQQTPLAPNLNHPTPAQAIVNGWMNSPPHRANILHGAFRDIGIGIKLGAPGQGLSGGATYVTDFGKH